jgi:hypothetical protein
LRNIAVKLLSLLVICHRVRPFSGNYMGWWSKWSCFQLQRVISQSSGK